MLVAQASHARLQLAPPPEDTATRAKAAVSAGREAASRRDLTTALERFEEALALRPAASLHFNIAVCHHNLMLAAAPGDEVYESHRRAAIESYGRYLDASPDAEDRASIEATMKELEELGGRPEAEDEWVIERLDPDDVPVAPALRDAAEPAPPAQTEPRPPPGAATPGATPPESLPLTGRLGPFVPLTLASLVELSESDEAAAAGVPAMRALPGIGLGVRGSAFLGARRRISVGGELWATGQPISSRARPVLVSGALAPTVEYRHPVLRGRMEIGAGGALGVTLQTLRYAGDTPPSCAVSERGALSTRAGVLLSGRVLLTVLLGERRNHELSLRVSPGLAAFGPASRAKDDDASQPTPCSELPTPFESLGLSGRAALVVMIDLGYAPRF
jgi:hypothetical protein